MKLNNAILHRLEKSRGSSGNASVTQTLRDEELPLDSVTDRATKEIRDIYTKVTNGYGTFDDNQDVYQFPNHLKSYLSEGISFVDFSRKTASLVSKEMSNEPLATGGYLFFVDYSEKSQRWLLVAALKLRQGTGVDDENLSLHETLSLDLDHLHEAARVNIDKWNGNEQPYLSFIQKRPGSGVVSKYFREALACTEYTDAKFYTEQTMEAIERYCADKDLDHSEVMDARRAAYEYFEQKRKEGEPINIKSLSARLDDSNPEGFEAFLRVQGYEVSESYRPHKDTYQKYKRIKRRLGTVRVSFDVADLIGQRVDLDEGQQALVIRDLPEDLIHEIKSHLPE